MLNDKIYAIWLFTGYLLFRFLTRHRPRAVPWEKGGPADKTSRNEIRPLFALVKLAPPLHKHYLCN